LGARVGETGKHTPSHPHTDCVKTAGLARLWWPCQFLVKTWARVSSLLRTRPSCR